MRPRILDKVVPGLCLFLMVFVIGCGGTPTGGNYKDGRIIVRNSLGDEEGWIYSDYDRYPVDDRRVKFTLKVTVEEEITYVGPLEARDVTKETGPLLGGARVYVDLEGEGGECNPSVADITVLVDGNVYIEAYSKEWEYWYGHQIKLHQMGVFPYE